VGVIGDLADRMAVMYAGRIVEDGPTEQVLASPRHPYTRGLLAAMPRITGDISDAKPLPGRPPDLSSVPREGCVFRSRCPLATDECAVAEPPVTTAAEPPASTAAEPPASTAAEPPASTAAEPPASTAGDHRFACFVAARDVS
jgi:peptide/nickel transport system ATP-binding protein